MDVELFNFELPKDLIALRPARPRSRARMLVVKGANLGHHGVMNLADHLTHKDILVFNNTRVVPGRLHGKRGNANIEITLHKRVNQNTWQVFARPAKKIRLGDVLNFGGLEATVTAIGEAGERTVAFDLAGSSMTDALEAHGEMPLPPYIASKRAIDEADNSDYQTIYAQEDGAVAAPTAGLHFNAGMMEKLDAKGIQSCQVTLHVGAGTFLPVKVDDTNDHKMHSEWGEITRGTADQLNAVRTAGGRIVAVGTTSLRLLESAADDQGAVHPFSGDTDIFITPGYKFKAVDALMTNFHLPASTLFMLVCAFAGFETMQDAYKIAIKEKYRFYSYGDSSLLLPNYSSHSSINV